LLVTSWAMPGDIVTIAICGGDGGAATSANVNGPAGVAVYSAGNLYIADYSNHRIRMVVSIPNQFTEVAVQVSVTSLGILYSRVSKLYTGTLTITSNGAAISGTIIDVALSNITPGSRWLMRSALTKVPLCHRNDQRTGS